MLNHHSRPASRAGLLPNRERREASCPGWPRAADNAQVALRESGRQCTGYSARLHFTGWRRSATHADINVMRRCCLVPRTRSDWAAAVCGTRLSGKPLQPSSSASSTWSMLLATRVDSAICIEQTVRHGSASQVLANGPIWKADRGRRPHQPDYCRRRDSTNDCGSICLHKPGALPVPLAADVA